MEQSIALQVGVKILLKNDKDQYLLLHRSVEKYPDVKGRWDIVGGRINPGTPLLENLVREVNEETKLAIIGNPKLVAAQDILRNPSRHIVRLTYIGETKGEVVLDTSENDIFRWCSWEELCDLDDVDVYVKELLSNPAMRERLIV